MRIKHIVSLGVIGMAATAFMAHSQAIGPTGAADANPPVGSVSNYVVKLYYGKQITLTQPAAQMLCSNALALLATSNFNSSKHYEGSWPHYEDGKIRTDYTNTVSGRYLLVSFNEPRPVNTVGGDVTVKEIVIGLNREDYASRLFTVDGDGHIIAHGKYSGPMCVALLQQVKKLVSDAQ